MKTLSGNRTTATKQRRVPRRVAIHRPRRRRQPFCPLSSARNNPTELVRSTHLLRTVNPRKRTGHQDLDIPAEQRRTVVCDGENLAYNPVFKSFDASRISAAVSYFERLGHRTVVLIPMEMLDRLKSTNVLNSLYNENKLKLMESRMAETGEENTALEIELLRYAIQENAAIISERDFPNSCNADGSFMPVLRNRVIGYCFFKSTIFIPDDPYGRSGPWLNDILRK
ncbi:protein KHNYN-like [Uranotaenia lowii]|uniref:protein KHNYN-like n=1 Tax=Uranotaenia lowii TaxID=190385 RepID=UPI00247A8B8C|nr:protein KHNYN-like [Uranotaenia lowii]